MNDACYHPFQSIPIHSNPCQSIPIPYYTLFSVNLLWRRKIKRNAVRDQRDFSLYVPTGRGCRDSFKGRMTKSGIRYVPLDIALFAKMTALEL
jgi:hypothetical protein